MRNFGIASKERREVGAIGWPVSIALGAVLAFLALIALVMFF